MTSYSQILFQLTFYFFFQVPFCFISLPLEISHKMIALGEILKISSSTVSLLSYFITKNSFFPISLTPRPNSTEMCSGKGEKAKLGQGAEGVSENMV